MCMVRYNLTWIRIVSQFALQCCEFVTYNFPPAHIAGYYKMSGFLYRSPNPHSPLPQLLIPLPVKMPVQDENVSPHPNSAKRRERDSALQAGPRKKPYVQVTDTFSLFINLFNSCLSDPLIHHGRHFGRTLHALCNINSLLTNGVLRTIELDEVSEDSFTVE